jgi:hypothetical protein
VQLVFVPNRSGGTGECRRLPRPPFPLPSGALLTVNPRTSRNRNRGTTDGAAASASPRASLWRFHWRQVKRARGASSYTLVMGPSIARVAHGHHVHFAREECRSSRQHEVLQAAAVLVRFEDSLKLYSAIVE